MARHLRIQQPDLLRHVMARGNGRMQIFLDDADYRKFVFILGDELESLGVECWSYCLMPNHYHAAVRPSRDNLSLAMQRIHSRYAMWWNHRHQRVGHVFQGRYKAQLVQTQSYLLALARYIAMNPVRANLVTRPEQWVWSSFAATVGQRPMPAFVHVDEVLQQFGADARSDQQARFSTFVCDAIDHDPAIDDRIRSNERIIGDAVFKRMFDESRIDAEPREELTQFLASAP